MGSSGTGAPVTVTNVPYTGTEIFNISIAIIDELSDTGTVSDSQIAEYKNRAPYLLDMWQREIARLENTTNVVKITALTQELQIAARNCPSGAYYLAMHFALADQNSELVNICRDKYNELKRESREPMDTEVMTDEYPL